MAISRRAMLRRLAWAGAGLTVVAGTTYAYASFPALPHRGAPKLQEAAAWLRLTPEGRIQLALPRTEMGQGIAIALRQIVAEETGFPLDRIDAIQPRTDLIPATRATVGSDSIKDYGPLLARAAAALARTLSKEGSVDGAPPRDGWARLATRPRLVEADNMAGVRGRSFDRRVPKRAVGMPVVTDDVRAIVTGSAPLFADDVRLPDMAHGAALPPPRIGAALEAVDDIAARDVDGYLGLWRNGHGTFVAAETRGALERSLAAMQPTWTGGAATLEHIEEAIDIDGGLARGALEHEPLNAAIDDSRPFDLDLRLDVPMAAHAAMEPQTAVARFTDGKLEVWTGTQDVTFVRSVLSDELSLSPNDIVVYGCRVGGGFGLKTICTVELEAAVLSRSLGRPAKVQWTRLDAFRRSFHRPPSSHRIRARISPDGRIDTWHHAYRSGHVIFTSAAMGPALQWATSFVGDPGVLRGAIPPYDALTTRVEYEDVRLPVHTGPWRGLGAAPNVWAIETAIDQLARRRGDDPLAFRKRNIKPEWPRLARALDRVAAISNWGALRSTAYRGYGLACGIYKEMSYAAVVAEVVRDGIGYRVTRLWCAHDCGFIVNPDQVHAQVEGNLVWCIGMALTESLGISDGHVSATSFADYAVARFSDVPPMTVDLIDEGEPASGAGETAIVAGTAAITNAISAMAGRPVTRIPLAATMA